MRRSVGAGITRAEVASFVNPRRVPRMADAEAVVEGLVADGTSERLAMIGLVLNARGFHRATATAVDEVNLVVVASETFSQRNQGMSTEEAVRTVEEVVPLARAAGIVPTVTLSASVRLPLRGRRARSSASSPSPSVWPPPASTSSRSPTRSALPCRPTSATASARSGR